MYFRTANGRTARGRSSSGRSASGRAPKRKGRQRKAAVYKLPVGTSTLLATAPGLMAQLESQELPLRTTRGHPTQGPIGHWGVREQKINRNVGHSPLDSYPESLSTPYCLPCAPGGWQVTSPRHPSWLASTGPRPTLCPDRRSEGRKREVRVLPYLLYFGA